jgi:SprT-like protein
VKNNIQKIISANPAPDRVVSAQNSADRFISDNFQLTTHVQRLSIEKFGVKFSHKAQWNSRLRTTGGRFFPKDLHLDFNPKMVTLPEFDQIILHELTHYHLFRAKKGYQHQDADFKKLLKQVGGIRYAPQVVEKTVKYQYSCASCGQIYPRQRKIDTQKYRCGKCRGKLNLLP